MLDAESSSFRGYVAYVGVLRGILNPVFEIFQDSRVGVRFVRGNVGIWHVDYFWDVAEQAYTTAQITGITAEFIERTGLSWIEYNATAVRVEEFSETDLQARAVPTQ